HPEATLMKTRFAIRSTRYLGTFPRLRADTWVMVGQDGGQSVDLGDQTLFLFSDTLFAELDGSHRRPHRQAPIPTPLNGSGVFLANSAGLSHGNNLRQALREMRYYTDAEGFPREILEPTSAERRQDLRFWPEHGIFLDGKVYFYYLGIQTIDRRS